MFEKGSIPLFDFQFFRVQPLADVRLKGRRDLIPPTGHLAHGVSSHGMSGKVTLSCSKNDHHLY